MREGKKGSIKVQIDEKNRRTTDVSEQHRRLRRRMHVLPPFSFTRIRHLEQNSRQLLK
jgi:hypothetical protein